MVFGTVLAVFFVPLAFVGVRRYLKWGHSPFPSKRRQT
jgi:hypothetical protein